MSEEARRLTVGFAAEEGGRPSGFNWKPCVRQVFSRRQFSQMALAEDGDRMKMATQRTDEREDANEVSQRPLMHDEQRRRRHLLSAGLARRGGFGFGLPGSRLLQFDLVALNGYGLGVPDVAVVFENGAVR